MARGRHGPLSAAELAEAAVLGDVALVLSFAGWLLPFPLVFFAAATVPFAALTVRRRLRAVVIATVASGQVAFLLGGFTLEINHILVALLGLPLWLYSCMIPMPRGTTASRTGYSTTFLRTSLASARTFRSKVPP